MVYVPNYLSAIQSVTDASEEEWGVTTYLPWDVRHYFQWKKLREDFGDVVPDLMLLGADTGDRNNPVVVLTEANFTPINTTYPNRRKCGIYNCTEFRKGSKFGEGWPRKTYRRCNGCQNNGPTRMTKGG